MIQIEIEVASKTILAKVVALENIVVDHVTGAILHSERRPVEGRTVIVNSSKGSDAIGKSFNARYVVLSYLLMKLRSLSS